MRAGLRQFGVRFGAYHIYVPQLLKPGPSGLLAMLWGLIREGVETPGIAELPAMSAAGRTTIPHDAAIPQPLYRVVGYRVSGERAVRIDILERLADLIRPLIGWRPTEAQPEPPEGVVPPGGFMVTQQMTSLLGASGEAISTVLRSLGYQAERRPAPAKPNGAGEAEAGETAAAAGASEHAAEPTAEDAAAAPEVVLPESNTDSVDAALAALKHRSGEPAATVPTDAEPPSDAIAQAPSAEAEAAEGEEPAFVEIWRPGRGPRQRSRPPRQAKARPPKRAEGQPRGKRHAGSDRAGGHSDQRNRPAAAGRRIETKRIDPDSPFAALAALKAELEGQKSE
jgi:ATP-dependent RNA helicase SUPV3L1/SUV3